jgi:ubiquinone/menaquinone biosynthesis C-methylase UbiE
MVALRRTFLPAAGHDVFLPFYDPLVKLLGGDRVRRTLLDQAALRPHQRVLDVGCGTGTLAVLIKRLHPEVEVVGLDPDPKVLQRARRKAERAGVSIQLDAGFSDELPYADASFDRVFSSFMLHHLPADEKEKSLSQIRRVLEPGGSFHLLDFAGPEHGSAGHFARWLHSSDRLRDNAAARVLDLMRRAGFAGSVLVGRGALLFGHIHVDYYQAGSAVPAVRSHASVGVSR